MKSIIRIFVGLSVLLAASCQQFTIDTQMSPEKFAANVKLVSDALESYTLPAENPQPVIIKVSSNTPWTITGATEWLNVTPFSSSVSSLVSDVTITAQPNTGLEDRSATLVLKSDSYETTTYTIKVTQLRKGALFVQPIYMDYVAAGGQLSFTIETNQNWKVRSSEAWLTFGNSEGVPDPDGKAIRVIATAEPSSVFERSATVTVIAGDEQESFEVYQRGTFSVTPVTSSFKAAGETKAFSLKTDLPWEISSDQPWLTFSKTEGVGDGSTIALNAIAAANDGVIRTATVSIVAGGATKTFEVTQDGVSFNIIAPESTELPRLGGELVVEMDTTIDWSVSVEGEGFTAEKVDDTHFKVVAGFNNRFAPRKAVVTVEASTGNKESIEVTQDINFTFSGNCTVLEDGSVKIDGSAASRVNFKDGFRCVDVVLTMGEKHFGSKARFWFQGAFGGINIYNQLTLGGNLRIRTDGSTATGTSMYKNTTYKITADDLNAMNTYAFKITPNGETMDMAFSVDGNVLANSVGHINCFYYDRENTVNYYFGCYDASNDGTWYVVKSCDLKVVEEVYE